MWAINYLFCEKIKMIIIASYCATLLQNSLTIAFLVSSAHYTVPCMFTIGKHYIFCAGQSHQE